jgi:O-antigen/teichoic acid export membrane protein
MQPSDEGTSARSQERKLPPVLGRLLSGTFWLAVRTPLQAILALWTIPLILQAVGAKESGAYAFAWGFGFFQMLFEFGMGSALQRQISECWTKGDRPGVDRAIACGMNFYAAMALVQSVALLAVAYFAVPFSRHAADPGSYALIMKLLWLQALTAPCYGTSVVVSSVLQAARRYDFMPRFELLVIVARFLVLYLGVHAKVDFFLIVVLQTIVQVSLSLGPALWVMTRELGYLPRFRGTRREDYWPLMHISFYMFLIQLSVVLADKLDTTILGYTLTNAGAATAVYTIVSKPFSLIRQSGWTLAYMVMPAVASLAAARDDHGLERVKYDGTRLHIGALVPIALLAWVYAPQLLTLWIGDRLEGVPDASVAAGSLRLFLLATLPLVFSVPVQVALGMNKIRLIALSSIGGALINLPISIALTLWLKNINGVILGTVLTTLFSNFLIPGLYLKRVLNYDGWAVLKRTLAPPMAGALALLLTTSVMTRIDPFHPSPSGGMSLLRWWPLIVHLAIACVGYIVGYLLVPIGRGDLNELAGKLKLRRRASA